MAKETREKAADASQADTDAREQDSDKPQISLEVADAGMLKKKITVTVPAERVAAKQDEMFGELSRSAQVPGFRVGRAPRRLIEKRFGKEVVQDVRNALVGESMGEAIEKSELKTLGEPDLDLDGIQLPDSGDLTYDFEVQVHPEFDLPNLEGIEVQKQAVEIDDARIDEAIDQLRHTHVRYEETDAAAASGDMVLGAATISGQGIEDLSKPGLTLRVAPGQIEGLPLIDLGEALAGKKAGDIATVKLTVPEAHPNAEWRGKELTVAITVSQVRRRVLPELNAEFAAAYGLETPQQLRQQVRQSLEGRVQIETQRAMRDQICRYLLDGTDFDLPEELVARHTDRVLQRRYVELLQRGVAREQIDQNLTELQAAASDEAKNQLKLTFILSKIAEQRQLQVDPEEINSRIAEMAQRYNRRPERLRQELAQDGTLAQVESAIREEKALDDLLKAAKIKDVAATKAKPKAAKKAKSKKAGAAKAKKASAKTPKKKAEK